MYVQVLLTLPLLLSLAHASHLQHKIHPKFLHLASCFVSVLRYVHCLRASCEVPNAVSGGENAQCLCTGFSPREMVQSDDCPTDCGVTYFQPNTLGRIVSGNEARLYSWPWQVSLQKESRRCIQLANRPWQTQPEPEQTNGEGLSSEANLSSRAIPLAPHHSELDYDVALVKPMGDILGNHFIHYACLPRRESVLRPGHFCWVTGWGDTRGGKENLTLSEVMNQVKLPIIDFKTCKQKKFWGDRGRDSMICTGLHDTGGPPAACQGDSGGPLVCQIGREKWEVHSVVSFGPIGCTMENKPSVFTCTSAYISWIEATRIRDFFLH